MKFVNLKGRECSVKNACKYTVNWEDSSLSAFQKNIKSLLYKLWGADIVFEEFPVAGTRLRIDFYNASQDIALEVDGDQHYKFNKHFHGGSRMNFLKQLQRDDTKERFCELNGIKVIRITTDDNFKSAKDLQEFIDNYE